MATFENQIICSHWDADDGCSFQAALAYLGSVNRQDSPGWSLWPLWLYGGKVLPVRRKCCFEGAHMDTAVLWYCRAACGATSHCWWSFSLQGFSQVLVPVHISENRVVLSLQVCLVDFAISKQIISGGGQKQGEMRGERLAGVVKQPRRNCGCCVNSDEMWQQQSAEEIPKSRGKCAQMKQHWQSCWDCGISFHPLFVQSLLESVVLKRNCVCFCSVEKLATCSPEGDKKCGLSFVEVCISNEESAWKHPQIWMDPEL